MKYVYVEHQPTDNSYAVYVGGDNDVEGRHDSIVSYGRFDGWHVVSRETARAQAVDLAKRIAERIGGNISIVE